LKSYSGHLSSAAQRPRFAAPHEVRSTEYKASVNNALLAVMEHIPCQQVRMCTRRFQVGT
jgi:hypothetical protein